MSAAMLYRNPRCASAGRPYPPRGGCFPDLRRRIPARARAPGGTRTDNEARALIDRVSGMSDQLRSNCSSFNFLGDSDACANTADVIDNFINGNFAGGGAPALLEQSEDGDDSAHDRLVNWCHKMLDTLRTAYSDISSGDTFTDLGGAILQTAEDDANKAKKAAFPLGIIAAIIAAGVVAMKVL